MTQPSVAATCSQVLKEYITKEYEVMKMLSVVLVVTMSTWGCTAAKLT